MALTILGVLQRTGWRVGSHPFATVQLAAIT
jgi:hypothetical protein